MYFGAAYYPEHWSEERWETDVKMMKEAGFNVVRMAEFAWTRMEPSEGVYDFEWLDKALELLASNGIKAILGTPTAAPPKWLVDKHPDIYPEDFKGHKKGYGHRRYYCFNNRNFLHHAALITEKMAQRYGKNENVIGWQIDNELGCVDTVRCYCENCRREFHVWLREKYKNIEDLNERWGTVFSSQLYGNWAEIVLPTYGPISLHNPGLELDFRRFSSDAVLNFVKMQRDILKKNAPGQAVTTNMMEQFIQLDYFKQAAELDVTAFDIYPNNLPAYPPDPCECAFQFNQMRGIGEANFWILELQSGTPGGNIMRKTPKPGELRKWTYQAIAHGADCIVYFRWRTCLFGLEEYWHGILDHSGLPNRRYEEVKKTGEELAKLQGLIEDSVSGAEVAMLYSYELEWVFEIQPHVRDYKYLQHFVKYYRYFHENNVPVDIISLDSDISRYKVLVIPNLIMATDEFVKKIQEYVSRGGVVLMDYRTGAKDMDNHMVPLPLPGHFRELLGITVEEYGTLPGEEVTTVKLVKSGEEFKGKVWYDVINPEKAETLATYTDDYFAGKTAVTRNNYGEGKAFYLGTEGDAGLMNNILDGICKSCRIEPLLDIKQPGVEIVRRCKNDKTYYFVINHNTANVEFKLEGKYLDVISGMTCEGVVEMLPNGVRVLCSL